MSTAGAYDGDEQCTLSSQGTYLVIYVSTDAFFGFTGLAYTRAQWTRPVRVITR